jgi:PPOX class probable F420-dependent enzyme
LVFSREASPLKLTVEECRSAFASARVARLATVDAAGVPHLVPFTFVVDGACVYFAVDGKPKRSTNLRRLRNIEQNPHVSVLVDEYDEDWSRLWWARVDGLARELTGEADADRVRDLLRARYPQYAEVALEGPVVQIQIEQWTGWRYADR